MKDKLGDRMKSFYENRTKTFLPRRTFTIIRIDGKAFHTYTKGLPRPFDYNLIRDMDDTAKFLCENIQGAKFGYVQSDEISIVLTDFDKINTSAWFDGNVQKICSISSSLATAKFNELRNDLTCSLKQPKLAFFDSRCFTIPSLVEVQNYFIWRQQDTIRNSISSVAQSHFSPKQLNGKSTKDMKQMIIDGGFKLWENYNDSEKYGRLIIKETYEKDDEFKTLRTRWVSKPSPVFVEDKIVFEALKFN